MDMAVSFHPVAENWPIYFFKGDGRCKHSSLMQRQSHFLRWGKEQRHYVMTLFSVCSTCLWCHLTVGVVCQHLSKAELQKMKWRDSEVQTNLSVDVTLDNKAYPPRYLQQYPDFVTSLRPDTQILKEAITSLIVHSVFLYLGFSCASGILYRAIRVWRCIWAEKFVTQF